MALRDPRIDQAAEVLMAFFGQDEDALMALRISNMIETYIRKFVVVDFNTNLNDNIAFETMIHNIGQRNPNKVKIRE